MPGRVGGGLSFAGTGAGGSGGGKGQRGSFTFTSPVSLSGSSK